MPWTTTSHASNWTSIAYYIENWRKRALQGLGIPGDTDTVARILIGLTAENYAPDPATDALARYAKAQQFHGVHRASANSREGENCVGASCVTLPGHLSASLPAAACCAAHILISNGCVRRGDIPYIDADGHKSFLARKFLARKPLLTSDLKSG